MFETEKAYLLSTEAAVTLVAGLIVGLIPEMPWWLRGLRISVCRRSASFLLL
jgi:hypothetical protein